MSIEFDGFDWDHGNIGHCAKHGVSKDEVEHVLENMSFFIPDPYPHEPRRRTAGQTLEGRHVFIVFMHRNVGRDLLLRPISARYMHEKEVNEYERIKEAMANPADR
ncbi:BrnT family toxin (plasmid) [Roseivivax marinus]|uniref:BrnT family toxin n=1 Tax=Roseivivax marinus TaxID=1379903 RepID=UPI001F03D2B9|nr:BrnT family toxin [Roseivivax marinus]UMA67301.1 BrnT family toxin [Roseivivax marinus]